MNLQEGHSEDSPDYGDFVDSDDEGDIGDVSEPLERYGQGLYYPLRIGEVLVDRYRIEHKLGWGGYSTVWMAHDIQTHKDVALKIMVPGEAGEDEFNMQKEILRTVRDTSHPVTYQGTFILPGRGSNTHRVLVLPLLGPSLRYSLKKLPVATRVLGAKQLLVALKNLHEAGLVHRDLNDGAMMWELLLTFDRDLLATKYQRLGRPKKMFLGDDLWKEGEYVAQVKMPLEFYGSKLYLGDFGLMIKDGTSVSFKPQNP